MNPNESWIAEQARLLTLEDGFGPAYGSSKGGDATDDGEAAARGSSTA
ncbi:MAG: hypothetical protein ABJB39_03150 [Chloroflexota bacterium]